MISYIKYSVLAIFVLGIFIPQIINAQDPATLILSPSTSQYEVDDEFTVELKINSPESITALKAYLDFDPSLLSVISIDTEDSAFPYWWEKDFSIDEETGEIKLQASSSLPGYNGDDGLVAKINFKAKARGVAGIGYNINSLALRPNDENILSLEQSSQGEFNINGEDKVISQESDVRESTTGFGTINIIIAAIVLIIVIGVILLRNKFFAK